MKEQISARSTVRCPRCGSLEYIRKGIRDNKNSSPRLFRCKHCGKRFGEDTKEPLSNDIAEKYLLHAKSLDDLIESMDLKLSKSALYREVQKRAKSSPDWYELEPNERVKDSVIGIDTSGLKIGGEQWVYFHVAGIISRDPIAYFIGKHEDVATIEPELLKLRDRGYDPKIVVTDLAPELIVSAKNAFPRALIQGCLIHLKWLLDKQMPTQNRVQGVSKTQAALWRKIKEIILCAAFSKDEETRRRYLTQLISVNLDEKAKKAVVNFINNLKYYHTLNELEGYETRILYNNVSEREIEMVKGLWRRMRGFKSIDAAHNTIKFFWFLKRRNQIHVLEEEKDNNSAYVCFLPLFQESVNIAEISKATGIPLETLATAAEKIGHVVVGNFTFSKPQLRKIKKILLRVKNVPLEHVMHLLDILDLDQWTLITLLRKIGIRVTSCSLSPSDIIVAPDMSVGAL